MGRALEGWMLSGGWPAASLKIGQLEQPVGVPPLRATPGWAGKLRHAAPRTLAHKTVFGW